MHRVTGGDPLLFEARENFLDAYRQLRDTAAEKAENPKKINRV